MYSVDGVMVNYTLYIGDGSFSIGYGFQMLDESENTLEEAQCLFLFEDYTV